MAIQQRQASVNDNAAGGTTVSVPIVTPTAGDKIVMGVSWRSDTATASPDGTGWTEIQPQHIEQGGDTAIRFQAWEKVADGSEGTALSVTFSAASKAVLGMEEFYDDAGGDLVLDVAVVASGTGTVASASTGIRSDGNEYIAGFATHKNIAGFDTSGSDIPEDGRDQTTGDTNGSRNRLVVGHLITSGDSSSKTMSGVIAANQAWIVYVAAYMVGGTAATASAGLQSVEATVLAASASVTGGSVPATAVASLISVGWSVLHVHASGAVTSYVLAFIMKA